jgi:hypothetical protein
MKSDIVIIGGGASGLMAAIGAALQLNQTENGGTVTVLEKMPKAGRKIMVTGKGRCNFTNVKDWSAFSEHIRTNTNFVSPAFHNLTPEDLVAFFKSNGLPSEIERGDRAYPKSRKSGDVVDALVRTATMHGVKIVTGCEVRSIEASPKGFRLECIKTTVKEFKFKPSETKVEHLDYFASKLIVATGGLSYPGSGSTGDGYVFAEQFGHKIETLFPSLTALVPAGYKSDKSPLVEEMKMAFRGPRNKFGERPRKEKTIKPLPESYPKLKGHIERVTPVSKFGSLLEGNTLENVQMTLYIDGNEAQTEFGDIEFTDGGLEGPLGFMVSRKAVWAIMNDSKVSVVIDMKPAVELSQLDDDIHNRWKEVQEDPRSAGAPFQKLFRILLGKLIPWDLTLGFLDSNPNVSVDTLASALKNWKMDIEGFVGFERAVVTAGGISTDEVVAKTLESKKQPGLYFTGEVLDMDCDTGGYNLQACFATGFLAGQSAAKEISTQQ